MALDKDGFLLAAFRKVQKIGKGLRSNGTSNIAGFFKETDSRGLGKTGRIASFFVDILLEQADLYSLVFFLDIQTFYQVLFTQVYSHCEIDSDLFVFSYQDCFVNMIRTCV